MDQRMVNVIGKKYEWPKEAVLILIDQWKKFDSLYNAESDKYLSRQARRDTYSFIAQSLNGVLPGITEQAVKSKIYNLRAQYSRELAKIQHDQVNYKPTAYWFPRLHFLNKQFKPIMGEHNRGNVGQRSKGKKRNDLHDILIDALLEESQTSVSTNGSKPQAAEAVEFKYSTHPELRSLTVKNHESSNSLEDMDDCRTFSNESFKSNAHENEVGADHLIRQDAQVFGQHVAIEMDKLMDDELYDEAQIRIQRILFEFKCKQRQKSAAAT